MQTLKIKGNILNILKDELAFWADKEECINTWILYERLVESVRSQTMRDCKNATKHVAFDGFIPSGHMLRCPN